MQSRAPSMTLPVLVILLGLALVIIGIRGSQQLVWQQLTAPAASLQHQQQARASAAASGTSGVQG